MRKSLLTWVLALCGIFLAASTHMAWAERRVALVVGNAQYKNATLNLANPRNDAEDIAAVLRGLDFEVILTINATKRDFDVAMTQFARTATGADAALFFYAGHALQYQGRNYLMPIDGEIEDEVSLRYQMTLLDDVRAAVERADGVKIIILDACRNNPIVDELRRKTLGSSRSLQTTRGLARIDKALGMVVAYATAADDVAADGTGRNSPFSSALLKRLQEPGLEIGSMFRRIAADVNEKTSGRQRPETYVSLIGEYYLNQKDRTAWEQVKDSTDPAEFRSFISRFPTSSRASDAQYRLQMLERFARERQPEQAADGDAARRRLAVAERERAEREAAQRRQAEEQRPPPAAEPNKTAIAALAPPPSRPITPSASPEACKADEERLVRVRASQSREDVVRLEAELRCERLRPQIVRLRESLSAETGRNERIAGQPPAGSQLRIGSAEPVVSPPPPASPPSAAAPPPPPRVAVAPAAPVAMSPEQEQACKRDEARLVRLRANPIRDEILRFERELGCVRLRAQLVRLRESLGAD